MRIAQTLLPPSDNRSSRSTRPGNFSANAQPEFEGDETILAMPGLAPSWAFLTQYLVREIMPRSEVPGSRWSYRDTVYRLGAQLSDGAEGQLALKA
jgi:hypothetical protein